MIEALKEPRGGVLGEGCPWRSVVSSPSGVRGGTPATNAFWAYFTASEAF